MPARRIEVGSLGFNVNDEGDGQPVLLLHGFPDTSRVWRRQIPALVAGGFRAIAPDLRGRGDSDIAESVDDYAMAHLIQDVTGIMDGLEIEKATIVGHDWGSALAWLVAAFAPERVERLVAISLGHPSSYSQHLTLAGLRKGWYLWVFKFEGIAEKLLTQNDWKVFREWFSGQADPEDYIEGLARPGRLTAGLNWYRANIAPESLVGSFQLPPIACPVLALHGVDDFALDEDQIAKSREFVAGPFRYERLQAGHWVQLDEPDRVNDLLMKFLKDR